MSNFYFQSLNIDFPTLKKLQSIAEHYGSKNLEKSLQLVISKAYTRLFEQQRPLPKNLPIYLPSPNNCESPWEFLVALSRGATTAAKDNEQEIASELEKRILDQVKLLERSEGKSILRASIQEPQRSPITGVKRYYPRFLILGASDGN